MTHDNLMRFGKAYAEGLAKGLSSTKLDRKNDELIWKQDAIDVVQKWFDRIELCGDICIDGLISLPSAQPEIIYCKDCVKHNKGHGYYYDGTVIGIKDCCPLVEIRGRAQGHEFDYQFCAYAERKEDEID